MGMERYRAIVRLEEIRVLYEKGELEAAKTAADSIKGEKIKDIADLFLLASVYRKSGDFQTAKVYLHRIYDKKVSWRVLEELMDVCLAEKNPQEAAEYLKVYTRLSGGDPRNYIYEYRIGRQMHRPDAELLPVLQTLKAEEYSEKYAYELAKLYHKLGRKEDCLSECAELILWFGEGSYVERAKALQAYYRGELSAEDIPKVAEQRIREAEERRAEARRAMEEEEKRRAEEYAEQERLRKLEEEVNKEESTVLPESVKTEAVPPMPKTDKEEEAEDGKETSTAKMPANETTASEESADEAPAEAAHKETQPQKSLENEEEEPMYATDSSVLTEESPLSSNAEQNENQSTNVSSEDSSEREDYEQISLFAPKTGNDEKEEEPQKVQVFLTQPKGEIAKRLAAADITLEEMLHPYARIESVRKQVVRMLEVEATVRKKCRCLVITGDKGSGKTTLGTYLARLLYRIGFLKTSRVAKITSTKLNQMKLAEKKEKLADVCLIIEQAGDMTAMTADSLLALIKDAKAPGVVILEDEAKKLSALMRGNSEINRLFNNRVHLPKYSCDELADFAVEFIGEQDYEVDAKVLEILKEKAELLNRTKGSDARLPGMMEIAQNAIARADVRIRESLLSMASMGDFAGAGAMELVPEDFE